MESLTYLYNMYREVMLYDLFSQAIFMGMSMALQIL